jgi:CheY-like chemotaxis protein
MTRATRKPALVLVAEDDPDDCLLVREAWLENRLVAKLQFVSDGEELTDYLRQSGRYARPAMAPRPDLILLDLNMPRKDGREALKEIKSDPALRRIPVVVLTTSQSEEDISRSYDLGVNSFIVKPAAFDKIVELVRELNSYWFETVELAREKEDGGSTPPPGGRRRDGPRPT